jgi:hypothetical protein
MLVRSFFLFAAAFLPAFCQTPSATLRVEVRAGLLPAAGAQVTVNGKTSATDASGIAVLSVPLGTLEVAVVKEGFLAGKTSVTITEAREWQLTLVLQPQPSVKEEITVYATRTGARLQDSPTRVEVLEQEEIEERC